jgi:hypothetical protein
VRLADSVHFESNMLTKFSGVAIALAMTGCMVGDEPIPEVPGEELTSTEQLLSNPSLPSHIPIVNSNGHSTTVSTAADGRIDLGNPFFADLGTNDRRCVTCHLPTAAWTITPAQMQAIFALTAGGTIDDGLGLGAVFRTNDGSNSPNANVSSVKKRRAAPSSSSSRSTIRTASRARPSSRCSAARFPRRT